MWSIGLLTPPSDYIFSPPRLYLKMQSSLRRDGETRIYPYLESIRVKVTQSTMVPKVMKLISCAICKKESKRFSPLFEPGRSASKKERGDADRQRGEFGAQPKTHPQPLSLKKREGRITCGS